MSETKRIDREAVKVLAIAVGVREAARQLSIPENTVLAWSTRDKWFIDPPKPATIAKQNGQTISAIKQPAEALADVLRKYGCATKVNLARAGYKASRALGKASGEALLNKDTAQAAKNWSGVASTVHAWEAKQQEVGVNLSILSISGDMAVQINQKE